MQLTNAIKAFVLWASLLCSSLSVLPAVTQAQAVTAEISWTSSPVPTTEMRQDVSRTEHNVLTCFRQCLAQEGCDEFCYDQASRTCLLTRDVIQPTDSIHASQSSCYRGKRGGRDKGII